MPLIIHLMPLNSTYVEEKTPCGTDVGDHA